MTKLTKKVALECALCAVAGNPMKEYRNGEIVFTAEEVTAKLNEMWAALDKKSGTEKPMTENQKQNVGFKDNILATLSDGKKRTATEILNETPEFPKEMSNQRVSALLRQLYLDGKVQKETVKGKTVFWTAEGV